MNFNIIFTKKIMISLVYLVLKKNFFLKEFDLKNSSFQTFLLIFKNDTKRTLFAKIYFFFVKTLVGNLLASITMQCVISKFHLLSNKSYQFNLFLLVHCFQETEVYFGKTLFLKYIVKYS